MQYHVVELSPDVESQFLHISYGVGERNKELTLCQKQYHHRCQFLRPGLSGIDGGERKWCPKCRDLYHVEKPTGGPRKVAT